MNRVVRRVVACGDSAREDGTQRRLTKVNDPQNMRRFADHAQVRIQSLIRSARARF
jgi:hypothetical protein